MTDNVIDHVNPDHYKESNVECIDAIQASMTQDEYEGFLKGNIIKYIWRYKQKGGVTDLKKAQWYLNKLIINNNYEKENL